MTVAVSEELLGDAVRWVVLAEILLVGALYADALVRAVRTVRSFNGRPSRSIMTGRCYRLAGTLLCFVFLAVTALTRMGHPLSTWRTVVAQAALLCFAEAWRRLDHVRYRPRGANRSTDRVGTDGS